MLTPPPGPARAQGWGQQVTELKDVGAPNGPPRWRARQATALPEIGWRHVSGGETWVVGVDVERDDAPRMVLMISGARMALWSWVPTAVSATPRISRKWTPSWTLRHLVDHEGHVRIRLHVAIFALRSC